MPFPLSTHFPSLSTLLRVHYHDSEQSDIVLEKSLSSTQHQAIATSVLTVEQRTILTDTKVDFEF